MQSRFRALRVRCGRGLLMLLGFAVGPASSLAEPLTLVDVERLALADEPGLGAHLAEARALREEAVADRQLPDPELTAAAFNFPVDGFDFDQEPITQVRVGVRQRIPGGGERAARSALTNSRAAVIDEDAALRVRNVLLAVRLAMIELAWRRDEARELSDSLLLLSELEKTSLSGYRQGRGAQQDVLRARLEQQVLQDRLAANDAAQAMARAELARWIGEKAWDAEPVLTALPRDTEQEMGALLGHPRLRALDAALAVAERGVALARTGYAPDWSLEVTYGARDQLSPVGDRPDFLTAAVSVQLPLFAANRQDRRLAARTGEREATRARRLDAQRDLERALASERSRERELLERLELHEVGLLPLAEENVAAARAGLATDTVDYAEVVRAALAEIELRLRRDEIRWQLARSRAQLAWLTGDARGTAFEENLQ